MSRLRPTPFSRARRVSFRRAFSLVELLVVLTVIAILSAMSLPAINVALRSYRLDTTGQTVVNQLALARQGALTANCSVEVRFYCLPDYSQSPTATPTVFRAMQAFKRGPPPASGNPTLTPVTKPVLFPSPIIISTTQSPNSVSPLVTASSATAAGTSDPVLPVYQSNYSYALFHFKPDGTTDITASPSTLTLTVENDKAGTTGLPANYYAIEVDPVSGTTRVFRP